MLVEAVTFLPDINIDEPIQLTLFASAETVTVTVVPDAAVAKLLGEITTLPVTPELFNICNTSACTFDAVAAGSDAWRAPSRDAVTSSCFTIVILPISISPMVNRIINGATSANSTNAAPIRRLKRRRIVPVFHWLMHLCFLVFDVDFMIPDRIDSAETISQVPQANKSSRSKLDWYHRQWYCVQ